MAQTHLNSIQPVVLAHLQGATQRIDAAVAWFTDHTIFDLLLQRLRAGVRVTLVLHDDTINHNTAFDWPEFGKLGGQAWVFGDASETMHHKFCLIDGETLLLGSYNWTYRAAHRNRENLLVLTAADGIDTAGFQQELEAMIRLARPVLGLPVSQTWPDQAWPDQTWPDPSVLLQSQLPGSALMADPMPDLLRVRIRTLEIEIAVLDEEKKQSESRIDQYHYLIRVHVGDLLIAIADLNARIAERLARQTQRRSDADRAENVRAAYEQARQHVHEAAENPAPTLTDEAEAELRRLFRKAAIQAHPDRFIDDPVRYTQANAFMARLNAAYKQKDLNTVCRLLDELENGRVFDYRPNADDDRDALEKRLARLFVLRDELNEQIATLQHEPAYHWMTAGGDFAPRLADIREQLLRQQQDLETQLVN